MSIFYQTRNEAFHSFISYNNSYPPHLHKQTELTIILSGSIDITIGRNTYNLNAGDISVAFPNAVHCSNTANESTVLFVFFDINFLSDYTHEFTNCKLENPVVNMSQLSAYGKQAADNIISLAKETSHSSYLFGIQKGNLYVLISDIFSVSKPVISNESPDTDISRDVLLYLDKNITKDISLSSTAKALGISKYYLSHIFSDKLKISFPAYVTLKRLELAESMLRNSNSTITDIAFEAGFSSTRSFYRCFGSQYGCSPKEYLKKLSAK